MIAALIRWSVANRFLVLIATAFLVVAGVLSVARTPLDALADPFLRDGRLVTPFEHVMEIPYAYYLLYRRRDASERSLTAFRRWLKSQLPAA